MASVSLALQQRSIRAGVPLQVHFDLTYRCNECCVHCYLDHKNASELTTDEVEDVLRQLKNAGCLFLTLSGGEIFLRPDLFSILETSKSLAFAVSLKTNGTLITAESAQRLAGSGVRKVQVSLYAANAEVHDRITKLPGSYSRTLTAIQWLIESGLVVKLSCPVMAPNRDEVRGVLDLADTLGIKCDVDPTISPGLDGSLELLRLRENGAMVMRLLQESRLSWPSCNVSAEETDSDIQRIPCSAGHNFCYISPNGDVFPCIQLPLLVGNLRRTGFATLWNGPVLQNLRAVEERHLAVCGRCDIRRYCARCPGLAQIEDGDSLGPSTRACELAEVTAHLAGRADVKSAYRSYAIGSDKVGDKSSNIG